MKFPALLSATFAVSSLLASPGLAHGGAHMHPHGSEPLIAGLLVLGAVCALLVMVRK